MKSISKFVSKELEDYRVLLRNVPVMSLVFFCLSVVLMNLLANRELLNFKYLALDSGFLLSWLSFLSMDMLTKRFGAKASIKLSLVAMAINLFVAAIFAVVAHLPGGNWGEYYTYGDEIVNKALDATIGGTWYVLLGSTIAFVVSAIVNSNINQAIGKRIKNSNFKTFALRSYVSTMIGQFIDNLIFAFIVSLHFFGWTTTQCITCALVGAVAELLCEVVFSPLGYRVSKNWEEKKIGIEYIYYQKRTSKEAVG